MFSRCRNFFRRHPLVRDALLWSIPALIFGAVLRLMMLGYLPYAYWGSDSRSYFGFTEQLLDGGQFSLYDKRRYFYPIFLLQVTLLPGAVLKWIAWVQHGFGLLTLLPLAYMVRKVFIGWKWWVVPITVVYAGLPILLWYEHELLAECIFFHAVVWMLAGWFAFAGERDPGRAAARFWWFFAGLALIILTKPAGRFFWPAVIVGLVAIGAWRVLKRKHWLALAALFGLTFTIGQDTQGAWLLYTSALPLTQLETPLHAEYKAEIAPLVRRAREQVSSADRGPDSKEWKRFLKFPERQEEYPLWKGLGENDALKQRIYKDLALEGIKAEPLFFLKIALGKIIASANPGEFKSDRFLPSYFLEKYERQYTMDAEKKPNRVRRIWGLRADEPLPPYSELQQRIAPRPDAAAAHWLRNYTEQFHRAAKLVKSNDEDDPNTDATPLAWWVLAGCLLAFLPRYWRTIGFAVLVSVSYLFGVFLVGGINPRYFGAVWAVVALALVMPFDLIVRLIAAKLRRTS